MLYRLLTSVLTIHKSNKINLSLYTVSISTQQFNHNKDLTYGGALGTKFGLTIVNRFAKM
jgi:hypothetical protein